MRAGPRGIASQFTCALATGGKLASKIATTLALQCFMPPPGQSREFLAVYLNAWASRWGALPRSCQADVAVGSCRSGRNCIAVHLRAHDAGTKKQSQG